VPKLSKTISTPGDTVDLCMQRVSACAEIPEDAFFVRCVAGAIAGLRSYVELTVRIVDEREGLLLNKRWRGQNKATNVLSFPVDGLSDLAPALLGDIVICAPLVAHEAAERNCAAPAHWAHLTVHGVLHLLGFDHQDDNDAMRMEERERAVLAGLGYSDPYRASSTL
jgi:probable rRNA maturation factor